MQSEELTVIVTLFPCEVLDDKLEEVLNTLD
jgi:hypothetical protein